jgi:hypothetical protein
LFYSAQQPKESTPFEIARVLVRFDHVASRIVNADQQFSDGVISGVISLPDYPLHTLKIRNFYYL